MADGTSGFRSAPKWGSGGRGFKSPLPDQSEPQLHPHHELAAHAVSHPLAETGHESSFAPSTAAQSVDPCGASYDAQKGSIPRATRRLLSPSRTAIITRCNVNGRTTRRHCPSRLLRRRNAWADTRSVRSRHEIRRTGTDSTPNATLHYTSPGCGLLFHRTGQGKSVDGHSNKVGVLIVTAFVLEPLRAALQTPGKARGHYASDTHRRPSRRRGFRTSRHVRQPLRRIRCHRDQVP